MDNAQAKITLLCPICRARDHAESALAITVPGAWQCAQGHHFDQAKQGYLNLLPAQFKRSKDPGDSKPMVQARRRFLQAGYYAPIAEQLAALVARHTPAAEKPLRILDAGCGEGYYLRSLQQFFPECQLFGNDVSKSAVQAAAPWHKSGHYVVASNARLPYPGESFDVIICAFGFSADAEFLRVLKPRGIIITLDPGADHLQALRDVLYEQNITKSGQTQQQLTGFKLHNDTALQFRFTLQQAELQDLLAMTPHAHRAPASGRQRLVSLESLQLEADVTFRTWQVADPGERNHGEHSPVAQSNETTALENKEFK